MLKQLNNTTWKQEVKTDWKDELNVVIGDDKQPDFKPQIKIERWSNEVNCSIRLIHNEKNPIVSKEGDMMVWSAGNIKSHFYEIASCEEHPEGGYEFDIHLKEKPATNKIEFTLNTKGLDFFYQPPLTEEYQNSYSEEYQKEIVVSETQVKDLEGNVLVERPENVVGSYAVYASEQKTNWEGGKLYRTGQVGMIYRPKIIDSAGTEVWGELNIANGILSVTIPQKFLDKAIYPIRHAAGLTFGYTTAGGSNISMYGWIYGSNYTRLTKGALYNSRTLDTLVTNGTTGERSLAPEGQAWKIFTFSTPPSVSASTEYQLMLWAPEGNGDTRIYYNSGLASGTYLIRDALTYGTWPDPLVPDAEFDTYFVSIYATYTASASGPAKLKTINGLAVAKVKTINGLAIAKVKTFNGLV
jgi:hypothetical protein